MRGGLFVVCSMEGVNLLVDDRASCAGVSDSWCGECR